MGALCGGEEIGAATEAMIPKLFPVPVMVAAMMARVSHSAWKELLVMTGADWVGSICVITS